MFLVRDLHPRPLLPQAATTNTTATTKLMMLALSELSENGMTAHMKKVLPSSTYQPYTQFFKEEILRALFCNNRFTLQQGLDRLQQTKQAAGYGKGGLCRRILKVRDMAFRCLDCSRDAKTAPAILCKDCFYHGSHGKHQVTAIESPDGCCDCGDSAIVKVEGFCRNHKGFDRYAKQDIANAIGQDLTKHAMVLVKEMLMFCFRLAETTAVNYDHLFSLAVMFMGMLAESTPMMQHLLCLVVTQPCNQPMIHQCIDRLQLMVRQLAMLDSQLCHCSLLDLILRHSTLLQESTCMALLDLLRAMLSSPEFGRILLASFARNFRYVSRSGLLLQLGALLISREQLAPRLLAEEQFLVCQSIAALEQPLSVALANQTAFFHSLWSPVFAHIAKLLLSDLLHFSMNKAYQLQFVQLIAIIDGFPLFVNDEYQPSRFSEFPLDMLVLEAQLLHLMLRSISLMGQLDNIPEAALSTEQALLQLLRLLLLHQHEPPRKSCSFSTPLLRLLGIVLLKLFPEVTISADSRKITRFCDLMHIPVARFQSVLVSALTQCFSSFGLMKKLQVNHFELGGQDVIRTIPNLYSQHKLLLHTLDVAFAQLAFQLLDPNTPIFSSLLSAYLGKHDDKNNNINNNNINNNNNILKLLPHFLELLGFLVIDRTAFANLILLDLRLAEEATSATNIALSSPEDHAYNLLAPFLTNYIQQFPVFSLQEIKNHLVGEILDPRISLCRALELVADFDPKRRRFMLKKELLSRIIDPLLLLGHSLKHADYIDFVGQTFRDPERTLITTLGRNPFLAHHQIFLSPAFLDELFTYCDQSLQIESKPLLLQIITPALRLANLTQPSRSIYQFLSNASSILQSLDEESLNPAIQLIQQKIGYDQQQQQQQVQQQPQQLQQQQQQQQQHQQQQQQQHQQQSPVRTAEQRKEQMRLLFKQKAQTFSMHLSDDPTSDININDTAVCLICKQQLDLSLSGSCALLAFSNLFGFIEHWNAKLELWSMVYHKVKDQDTLTNLESQLGEQLYRAKNTAGALQFEHCDHRIHFKCFFKIQPAARDALLEHQHDELLLCPQCKAASNCFLPDLTPFFCAPRWEFDAAMDEALPSAPLMSGPLAHFALPDLVLSQTSEVLQRLSIVTELTYEKDATQFSNHLENALVNEISLFVELFEQAYIYTLPPTSLDTQAKRLSLLQKVYHLYLLAARLDSSETKVAESHQHFQDFLLLFTPHLKPPGKVISNSQEELVISSKVPPADFSGEHFQEFLLAHLIASPRYPTRASRPIPFSSLFHPNQAEILDNNLDFQVLKCALFSSLVGDRQALPFAAAFALLARAYQASGPDNLINAVKSTLATRRLLRKLMLVKLLRNCSLSTTIPNVLYGTTPSETLLEQLGITERHLALILPLFEAHCLLRPQYFEVRELRLAPLLTKWGDMVHLHSQAKCTLCRTKRNLHLCIVCGDILCPTRSCDNSLFPHAAMRHENSCSFLNLTNAKATLCMLGKVAVTESLYCNKFGEEYNPQAKNANEYMLDQELHGWLLRKLLLLSDRYQ